MYVLSAKVRTEVVPLGAEMITSFGYPHGHGDYCSFTQQVRSGKIPITIIAKHDYPN